MRGFISRRNDHRVNVTNIKEALANLSDIVVMKELIGRGFRLFGLETGYTSWEDTQLARPPLTEVLQNSRLVAKGGEGNLRELALTMPDYSTGGEIQIPVYSVLTDEGLLLCVTKLRKALVETVVARLAKAPCFYNMWFPPVSLHDLVGELTEEYTHTRVNYFTAKRLGGDHDPLVVRPHVKRTIRYSGNDGKQALDELAMPYGLFLDAVGISIEGIAAVAASTRGVMSIRNIVYEPFVNKFLSKHAYRMISRAVEIKRVAQNARKEQQSVQMTRGKVEVPSLIPLVIKFGEEFTHGKASLFIESMKENGISPYNTVLAEGSVLLDSMVFDERKNSLLAINATSDRMMVIPHTPDCFDSLIRLYRLVVEAIDQKATCTTFHPLSQNSNDST
jgi:hypothetical protein